MMQLIGELMPIKLITIFFVVDMYLDYGLNVNNVVIGQLLHRSESVTNAG